ncbi:VHS domain-containing protein At3g16270-like isoform X3 [Cynara cardunculus var. scolymus]|uniref:VHS domain-containing protein At3g16270-like isoform X3 n=1 Tax=Cynara cardunculus var. scolymus TaxID=59895 RepID=UPI000D6291B6|nr:VHS domain-containing protein At3g16270-like isoform X3 [Cynara cardunculus var. scolymus]
MDTSRRAVESYWRSKMIDVATSDEDKVTPVYKLEEICELLRSSHVSIVKEISEFIFKRLQHKSPIVKQKALRVIKYAVGKSGGDFKREMQRNSVAVRQLIHHKGQPDPLKGDALNKSVRETAQEALSAIFAGEDSTKPPPKEGLTQRIEGFGNTNFDMPPDDNKSFLSGVVGIGSATIKQGLNSLTQGQTQSKNKTGTYRSPNLRRSLTNETSYSGSNERHNETMPSSRVSTDISGHWGQELKITQTDNTGGSSGSNSSREKSREERLLETIVTPGGIRLQPTRDALQAFLAEASKLNALALSKALEAKLQSHMWQVLSILNGEQSGSRMSQPDRNLKTEKTVVQMPDLIDTNDPNGNEHSFSMKDESSASLIDGFLGDGLGTDVHNNQPGNNDDPFADVSFHGQSNKEEHESADIFSGMATVDKPGAVFTQTMASGSGPELFDIFGSDSGIPQGSQGNAKDDLNDLMAGLSVNGNESSSLQNGTSLGGPTETLFSDSTANPNPQMSDVLSNILQFQAPGITPNPIFPIDPKLYNGQSSGLMFNPMAFGSQPINYGAMSNLLAQQQFLSTMTNLQQQTGNLQSQNIGPTSNPSGTQVGGYTSALPDIFNPIIASQAPTSTMNASKKDDTRAFDFISGRSAKKRPLYPWVGGRDKVCIHLTPGSSCCIS